MRKSALQIEQEILLILQEAECSLRELETRVNTNYNTIRAHCRVLEYFGMIEIIDHERNEKNGRPFKTAKITARGRKILQERPAQKSKTPKSF